jgi:hypothetical protein
MFKKHGTRERDALMAYQIGTGLESFSGHATFAASRQEKLMTSSGKSFTLVLS